MLRLKQSSSSKNCCNKFSTAWCDDTHVAQINWANICTTSRIERRNGTSYKTGLVISFYL